MHIKIIICPPPKKKVFCDSKFVWVLSMLFSLRAFDEFDYCGLDAHLAGCRCSLMDSLAIPARGPCEQGNGGGWRVLRECGSSEQIAEGVAKFGLWGKELEGRGRPSGWLNLCSEVTLRSETGHTYGVFNLGDKVNCCSLFLWYLKDRYFSFQFSNQCLLVLFHHPCRGISWQRGDFKGFIFSQRKLLQFIF